MHTSLVEMLMICPTLPPPPCPAFTTSHPHALHSPPLTPMPCIHHLSPPCPASTTSALTPHQKFPPYPPIMTTLSRYTPRTPPPPSEYHYAHTHPPRPHCSQTFAWVQCWRRHTTRQKRSRANSTKNSPACSRRRTRSTRNSKRCRWGEETCCLHR